MQEKSVSFITVLLSVILYAASSYALEWSEGNPEEMTAEESTTISIDGDCPPYTWKVSGEGFSIGASITEEEFNTLNSDADVCGSAAITVKDNCGEEISGYVRGGNGNWIRTDTYACIPTMNECAYTATGSLYGIGEWCDDTKGKEMIRTLNVNALCKKNWGRCQYLEGCTPPPPAPIYNPDVYESYLFTYYRDTYYWECPEIEFELPPEWDNDDCKQDQ